MPEVPATWAANQAGMLVSRRMCDQCGQERCSRWWEGEEPPDSGHAKPPQKTSCVRCRTL